MCDLLSLPFDIHVQIARNFSLSDCLTYSTLSPICHDAVYYIFSHRIQLDFSSLVVNNHLPISSDLFLKILHAHTRARIIHNFCIPGDFTLFAELSTYFHLYWQHSFIPSYDPADLEPDMICGTHVGHIRGHLCQIYYLGFYGACTRNQGDQMHDILNMYDDPMYGAFICPEDTPSRLLNDKSNWSSVDLDTPYTSCSRCDLDIEYPNKSDPHKSNTTPLCQQCRYIVDTLSFATSDDDQ